MRGEEEVSVRSSHGVGSEQSEIVASGAIRGRINKILSQSFVDGPGNRAVVFLQGCNFSCLYCHNPYMIQLCNDCGVCVQHCPQQALSQIEGRVIWDSQTCVECDCCIQACPHSSSPQILYMDASELWQEIEPVSRFLSGVTVSGGEATQQTAFVRAFFSEVKARSHLSTLVQTNGDVPQQDLEALLPVTDWFMVDLKAFDSKAHRTLTGHGNAPVIATIEHLACTGKLQQVRQVVIPGINDTEEESRQLARFLASIDPSIDLRFLRFRPHGARGVAQDWPEPDDEAMNRQVSVAREAGLANVGRSI